MKSQTMDEGTKPGKDKKPRALVSVNGGKAHDLDSPEAKKELENVVAKALGKDIGGVAGQRLLSFIERIERMGDEIKGLQDDRKDIFAEAKGVGFDIPVLRAVLKKRAALRKNAQKYREQLELFDLYCHATGTE